MLKAPPTPTPSTWDCPALGQGQAWDWPCAASSLTLWCVSSAGEGTLSSW